MIEQIKSLSYEDIKSKYGAYLESLDISKNTRYTACTDAFYLWRKRGKEAFWEVVLSDDFEAVCKKELTAILTSEAIVKVGAHGSLIRKGTEMVQVQAAPVEKVVDTTGCLLYTSEVSL